MRSCNSCGELLQLLDDNHLDQAFGAIPNYALEIRLGVRLGGIYRS